MGPQADGGGEQVSINDERLFTHNIFSAVFIKLRKFMIKDVVHTDDTEGHGCPQADDGKKCESSEFKRNLNGGPQADGGVERKCR